MMQSTSYKSILYGLHVAIIMDGNGRWATRQGLPRLAGHRAGAAAVRRAIPAALRLGIDTLTLFAFTAGNWERPWHEVSTLMELFRDFFREEKDACVARGILVNVIGRRDRLRPDLREAVEDIEAATARRRAMHLRIAVDYSARDTILRAAGRLNPHAQVSHDEFAQALAEVSHAGGVAPEVDLLIRTGDEQRLSDCLLWECAYAELVFSPSMWPDFEAADLEVAVQEFHSRQRRFGHVPEEEGPAVMEREARVPAAEDAALKTA
ncbi:MAG TPA: polyprenyl diphosphate synthase [Terriglobia bacterium]|nr:polyprenyl diphosphate synthase [Terriglobia bacterium]